nr:glycosyltransferase family 4 protein [Methanofollis liminatans]
MVLSDHYLTFVKDQTEGIAPEFERVDVCVCHNTLAEIADYLPVQRLKPFRLRSILDLSHLPENIFVHPCNLPYLPLDLMKKSLGDRLFRAVDDLIQKKQIECDLIHAHFLWPNGYAGALLKEKYGIPLVVTAHGYDIYDLPFRDQEWRDRIVRTLEAADAIITVSRKNEECIRSLGITKQVHVIPNGFRSDLFYPRDQAECRRTLGLPPDRKILLAVGNLVEVKGHRYLVEAMAEVVKERQDVLCVIVGSGPLRGRLERQVRALGLEEHVRFVGGKPHEEIPIWMNACDVFVLPSLNEGNPTVMFECLGCGRPFVGSDVGGVREIIISNDYGLVCSSSSSRELAEKIIFTLDRSWKPQSIIKYSNQFSGQIISQKIINIYHGSIRRNIDMFE